MEFPVSFKIGSKCCDDHLVRNVSRRKAARSRSVVSVGIGRRFDGIYRSAKSRRAARGKVTPWPRPQSFQTSCLDQL